MEEVLKEILNKLDSVDKRLKSLGQGQQETNERINRIEQTVAIKYDIETIFTEQQKDVMSMLHIIKNQLTEQAETTNNRLDRMSMDINYLVRKSAEHENNILSLIRAK